MRRHGVFPDDLEESGLKKVLFVTCYCTLKGNCTLDEKGRNCKDCEFSICVLDPVPQRGVAV
ncbi:MAG TPA: hypothetical protein PLO06_04660 [Methanoregulaceae archaeon]|nr:hypothetical protein [Methanoregulaceae archaeon]HPD75689.1 hypothetical protein [Methanoregulaceae archaeon]